MKFLPHDSAQQWPSVRGHLLSLGDGTPCQRLEGGLQCWGPRAEVGGIRLHQVTLGVMRLEEATERSQWCRCPLPSEDDAAGDKEMCLVSEGTFPK